MVKHIVMFYFKKDTDKAEVRKLDESFKQLPSVIREILSFESGLNISPENLNKGFTHIYSLSFEDEKARDTYLYHTAHRAFSEMISEKIEDVLVVDFEVQH